MQTVLILTPVKDAAAYLPRYFELLDNLTFDHRRISVAMLESDSTDATGSLIEEQSERLQKDFAGFQFFKRDYKFQLPDGIARWDAGFQLLRRTILARARNQLLFRALGDQDWVLWLDVDLTDYPADLIEQLLSHERDILHPNCVREPGGQSFDLNAWKDQGRQHMHDLRGSNGPVRIDSVGGTVLLVRADLHRDGLVFPAYKYGLESGVIRQQHPLWGKGEIETEGFAAMARDMGLQCWGLPDMEVIHA
jgi:glycosyltransferase involved in cell wall biosynthesis